MADLNDTSVYPDSIDGYSTLPLRKNLVHEIKAEDHNRLRNAIIKIQQELGPQPSGSFATVATRLDDIGDAKAQILAHIADVEDAHDASAISVLDTEDNYFDDDVEGVLGELATLLPPQPDVVGEDDPKVPNDGLPSFVDGYGIKFVMNASTSDPNISKKTQPNQSVGLRGLHIVELSSNTINGTGVLTQTVGSPATFTWAAPGDSAGTAVDLSTMATGDIATLSSANTSYKIRVAKNSTPFNNAVVFENFDVYALEAVRGYYSYPSAGFKYSRNITRTAVSPTATSQLQFMISGTVFPADRGTLVLQRKLKGTAAYFPVAIVDLGTNFDDSKRSTGQGVYTPANESFDHFLLYDRLPVSDDYDNFGQTADGVNAYSNYENPFSRMQVAKYIVPASVEPTDVVGGELESTTASTNVEVEAKVSTYRIIHYKPDVTDFTGNPSSSDVFSFSTFGSEDDGNNNVKISNVFVDSTDGRPTVDVFVMKPNSDAPNDDATTYIRRSGVRYYNSTSNDRFDIELTTSANMFNKTYLLEGILRFEADAFAFPSATTGTRTLESDDTLSSTAVKYGAEVDIEELFDDTAPTDGYMAADKYSTTNLPDFNEQAYYVANTSVNTTRRPTLAADSFSTKGRITARVYDPFGAGEGFDAYGVDSVSRVLVNTYSVTRATDDTEWFTDESKRVGNNESFLFNLDEDQFIGAGAGGTLNAWNSNNALDPGMLQCGGRFNVSEVNVPGLIFPQDNYRNDGANGVMPTQASTGTDINSKTAYDDASFQVDSIYHRVFSLGYASGGGKLRITSGGDNPFSFDDIKESNTKRFGKIEVKIPGNDSNSTGWLDIGKLFQTGKYVDGDGALAGATTGGTGDFTVPFTFGGRNNSNTGYMFAVRVTYFGAEFDDAKTRIITMIKLEA